MMRTRAVESTSDARDFFDADGGLIVHCECGTIALHCFYSFSEHQSPISRARPTSAGEDACLLGKERSRLSDLQKSGVDLGRFFELSLDPMCIADVEGRFVRVNDEFQRMLGYSAEELTGRPYIELVHPEDHKATDGESEKLRNHLPVLKFENRYRCKDGSWIRLSWRAASPDENGLIYAVARDVTADWREHEIRRAVEKRTLRYQGAMLQLRDGEPENIDDFLRLLTAVCAEAIETARVSVWFFSDDDESIVCRDLYRRTPAAHESGMRMSRRDFPHYFHAVDTYDALVIQDARTDAATREFDECYLQPNGIASLLDVPIRTGNRLTGILCFEHTGEPRQWDVFEEKFATSVAAYLMTAIARAERRASEAKVRELNATLERRVADRTAALHESEERFRSAMENSAIGMALVALDGKWIKVNRALCEIIGYSEEELQHLDFQAVTHPDDLEADLEHVRQMLSGEIDSYHMEKRYFHRNGGLVWGLLSVSLVRDDAGAPCYFISQVQDITERRKADAALRNALEYQRELARSAQAGEQARSEFLAMMSHEVRTPMNGVLGYGELLARMPGLPPEGRDYAETIVRSGSALLRILDDILDWSRLDAGALKIESVPFSPAELLRDIRTLLTPAAHGKSLELLVEADAAADRIFIGDAGRLRQIVLNLGGNAIKFTDNGSVIIGFRPGDEGFEFFVRDTGSGIVASKLASIFDPFVQADSSHSRRHGGAGLGLSISRRLAILMGGSLTASSSPGSGSEFVARIPLLSAANGDSGARTAEMVRQFDGAFAARHPLSILVVEDDSVNRRLILTMLRKFGYEPLFAKDGVEALEICQRERPQCILMDVQMPRMDGIEATREIRKVEAERGWMPVFICALTADTLVADRANCLAAGMDEYLNKPVRGDQLARMIEIADARHSN
jgi:PAS domain S-box-containing protein